MRTWDKEDEVGDDKDTEKVCTADIDLESAQATADHLGIPLKEVPTNSDTPMRLHLTISLPHIDR